MVTFTDLSNLTANERGFPEVPISSCSSVNMPTGQTCSRAPRLSCDSNTTGTNHPWSPPDQLQRFPERGQSARLGSRKGVHSSGPCSVLLEEDCREQLSLAAILGDGCYVFTSSILLPYDSAPWTSSTRVTNQRPAFGRVRALTDTHEHAHPAQVVKLPIEFL